MSGQIDGGLRRLFHTHLPTMDWWALETGDVCPGVPDSCFCERGVEGHVEFKATSTGRVKFRPLQPGTIVRRIGRGGRVFVAVRDTRAGGDVLRLFWGAGVVQLSENGVDAATRWCMDVWSGGPGSWDWAEVRDDLLRDRPETTGMRR